MFWAGVITGPRCFGNAQRFAIANVFFTCKSGNLYSGMKGSPGSTRSGGRSLRKPRNWWSYGRCHPLISLPEKGNYREVSFITSSYGSLSLLYIAHISYFYLTLTLTLTLPSRPSPPKYNTMPRVTFTEDYDDEGSHKRSAPSLYDKPSRTESTMTATFSQSTVAGSDNGRRRLRCVCPPEYTWNPCADYIVP